MKRHQPKIEVEASPAERALEVVCIIALAYTLLLPALRWDSIPATVPTHFDASGEVTTMGPRAALWLLVGITVLLYIGMSAIQRIPHMYNYPVRITEQNAAAQYRLGRLFMAAMKAWCVLLFAGIIHIILRAALGGPGVGTGFLVFTFG